MEYRQPDHSEEKVAFFKKVDELATQAKELIDSMDPNQNSNKAKIDPRWLAIAKTELQKGFMCLRRSIGESDQGGKF